jgi:hypothetical protein
MFNCFITVKQYNILSFPCQVLFSQKAARAPESTAMPAGDSDGLATEGKISRTCYPIGIHGGFKKKEGSGLSANPSS